MSLHPDAEVLRLRSGELEWRNLDGGIVALDLDRLEYLHVNRSGAALWRMLGEGATRAQLARDLVETYGLTDEQAMADVHAFVEDLVSQRLL